jgi:glucose/arabinose dehydrogenase
LRWATGPGAWWLATFTLLLVPAGCASGADGPPEASSAGALETAPAGAGPLIGVQSKLCLAPAGGAATPGTALQIAACDGQSDQSFTFTAAGELRVFGSTRCVAPHDGQGTSGTSVEVTSCNGQAAQHWKRNTDDTIRHQPSGLCLDVKGAKTAAGTPVEIYKCHAHTNQQWVSDTQPPTPPGGPTIANLTCNSATLSWTASTDDVGVAFYDVYHDGQLIKSVDGATLSTGITLIPGVPWGVYVNARDAAGNVSQASATLPVKPPRCTIDTQPPTQPTELTGTSSGTSVTLQWKASTDNVGVLAYDVSRDGVRVGTVLGTSAAPPATTFLDTGLAAKTSYVYTVVARDAQANVSPASAPVTVTTGQACTDAVCSVTQITTDTDIPWGLVTLPDGTIVYNRRDAHDVIHLDPATGKKTTLGTVPNVESTGGEGGLLGLAIAPTFASDHWLYIMHTSPTDNRIVRIQMRNDALDTSTLKVLLSGILRNKFHNGGRLRMGPDGKLYASTGDAQNGANAQNTAGLNGKVLRLNLDGSAPSDNPFGNYVWSYGHRNPQGLAFDSQGRLWEQEFGNSIMDETNLIQKGGNYGWPNCEGTSSQGGSGCGTPGYIAPKHTYPVADGSCSGITIVRGALYVACERGTRLYREVISGSDLTDVQQLFVGTYGRLRTVEPTPDGNLWLTTTNAGDKDSIPNNSNERIFKVLLGE